MHNSSVSLPIMRDGFTLRERIRIAKDRAIQGWLRFWNMGVSRKDFATVTIAVPLRKLTNEERLGLIVAIVFSSFLALVVALTTANAHPVLPTEVTTQHPIYHVTLPKHPCAWYGYQHPAPASFHCKVQLPPKPKAKKP